MTSFANSGAEPAAAPPPVYVVSGGVGASGEQLLKTALAQFPGNKAPIIIVGNVRHVEQLRHVVAQARTTRGLIAHTLVDAGLRHLLNALSQQQGVRCVDLMGPLLTQLAEMQGSKPAEEPGLYRRGQRAYFERVAAIEFALAHDDGQQVQDWVLADLVLVGVSRTGKTPLSIYLSVQGWKVANYPIVPDLPQPPELFQMRPGRVVALTIAPDQLLVLRQRRLSRIGSVGPLTYVDAETVNTELQSSLRLYRQSGFPVIDVTDKPIESTADEIMRLVTRLGRPER
jgi:[pyruvate, water dikinase]-phosphate phosphotransferase / [pyruvate, water dikinase] kinase